MPTTNNNWPTPVATDLVKDGWEAIKDLGDAIDTTLGVYAPSTPGLTLINTTSFSAVASFSLAADSFTSTYDNYLLIIDHLGSGTADLQLRLRAAGSDNSTGNYQLQYLGAEVTTSYPFRSTNQTFMQVGSTYSAGRSIMRLNIYAPKLSQVTQFDYTVAMKAATTAPTIYNGSGGFSLTTAFDSLSIITSTGTFSGTYYLYAYAK